MSSYRQTTTITKGANKLVDFTDNLQVYLGGVYNVALSLDMSSPNSQPIILLVDIFRSAFGPNLILKHLNIVPSVNLFNTRIYLSDRCTNNTYDWSKLPVSWFHFFTNIRYRFYIYSNLFS